MIRFTWVAALCGAGLVLARAQVLYDPADGNLPQMQGWSYLTVPGTAQLAFTNGAARLDTTAIAAEHAGFSRVAPLPLDRADGFTFRFTLRLEAEAHSSANRAGVSVIVLAADKRGIELGFWTDRIWAQSDQPLFTHAEESVFNPTQGFVDYALSIAGDQYALFAGGMELLSGPVRDYTPFVGPIDPYETPDFLFFGDDTGSASGEFSLQRVEVTPSGAPELTIEAAAAGTVALEWPVAIPARRLQGSDALGADANWEQVAGSTTVVNGANRVVVSASAVRQFFRLSP